jgi:hypothetical protein|tara:strand:+ start:45 stop:380 length:336 start_codon:yes stop_codon:yes gene_type:complete
MITSIPAEISQLGLNLEDYVNIAKNITRILNMPKNKWQNILDRANLELSPKLRTIALPLVTSMAYDRGFFKEAGFPYSNGPPVQGCFITALSDYLLRNKEQIENHINQNAS